MSTKMVAPKAPASTPKKPKSLRATSRPFRGPSPRAVLRAIDAKLTGFERDFAAFKVELAATFRRLRRAVA